MKYTKRTLRNKRRPAPEKQIVNLVLDGDPDDDCMETVSEIVEAASERGWEILFVLDAAADFVQGGLDPRSLPKPSTFAEVWFDAQLAKENLFRRLARIVAADRILLIYQGSLLTIGHFLESPSTWKRLLREHDLSMQDIFDRYDAVLYVCDPDPDMSAGDIRESEALLSLWAGHPHLRVAGTLDPEAGASRGSQASRELRDYLAAVLRDEEEGGLEIERKYLIKLPDAEWLQSLPMARRVEITQTYLTTENGERIRIRKRGFHGHYTYIVTQKENVTGITRRETEHRITEEEYASLLAQAGDNPVTISKDRWCFVDNGQYFELDIYPFWKDKAVLEIELTREEEPVVLPKHVEVLGDVSEDPEYTNFALAKKMAEERERK